MPEAFAVSLFGQIRNVCGVLLSKALHTQDNFPGEVPRLPQKCPCASSRLCCSAAAPTSVEGTDPGNKLILIWISLSVEAVDALLLIKQSLTGRNEGSAFPWIREVLHLLSQLCWSSVRCYNQSRFRQSHLTLYCTRQRIWPLPSCTWKATTSSGVGGNVYKLHRLIAGQ